MKKFVYLFLASVTLALCVSGVFFILQRMRHNTIKQHTGLQMPSPWVLIKKEYSLDFAEVYSLSLSPDAMKQFIQQNSLAQDLSNVTPHQIDFKMLGQPFSEILFAGQLTNSAKPKWEAGANPASGRVTVIILFEDLAGDKP